MCFLSKEAICLRYFHSQKSYLVFSGRTLLFTWEHLITPGEIYDCLSGIGDYWPLRGRGQRFCLAFILIIFCCCYKQMTKSHWERKGLFQLTFLLYSPSLWKVGEQTQSRNLKVGTETEAMAVGGLLAQFAFS